MDTTLGCPIVTPFTAEGAVDTDALATLVSHLVDTGIDRIVPCGTTGEATALTDPERRTVIETTVEAVDGRAAVMAGVPGTAVGAVRERIADAAAAGADSALVVAPYYGGTSAQAGLERFLAAVARDSPLPLFLYNIPAAAGRTIDPDTVCSLAERGCYEGIKDSSGDLTHLDELIDRTPPSFTVLQGWDTAFVPALVMGADGGINAGTHLAPTQFRRAARAVETGDLDRARTIQFDDIDPGARTCLDHGFAPVVKAVLAERELLPTDAVRPPLTELRAEDRRAVVERLDQ